MGCEGFVDVEGGRLHYRRDGDGPAIVLISGGFLDTRMYEPQVDALTEAHCLVRCDLRGFGRSSDPGAAVYRHCDDVKALLEALGITRACVGGQSLGGTVALDLAFAHPDVLTGIVLAPALPVLGWKWVEGFPVSPALRAGARGVDAFRAAFLDLPLTAPTMAVPTAAEAIRRMLDDYRGWHLRHRDPAQFAAPDAIDRLSEVDVPALVIVGSRDVPDSRLVAERLATGLARADHHVVADVGHAPNMEDPGRFNALVSTFLQRL